MVSTPRSSGSRATVEIWPFDILGLDGKRLVSGGLMMVMEKRKSHQCSFANYVTLQNRGKMTTALVVDSLAIGEIPKHCAMHITWTRGKACRETLKGSP